MSVTTLPEALSEASRDFASRQHQLLIGGERQPAADGRTFETLDPATGQAITTVAQAGAPDVDRAVKAARDALERGPWAPNLWSRRTATNWRSSSRLTMANR